MNRNIKKETLKRIKKENIKIKPKSYFKILKTFIYAFTIILGILSIYIFNLIVYLPKRSLRFAENQGVFEYLKLFPWPLLIIGSLTTGVLIYLYKNYEGGHRKHLAFITIIVFGSILIASATLANSNFNQKIEEKPRFRKMYDWQEENFVPGGRGRQNRIHRNQSLNPNPQTKITKLNTPELEDSKLIQNNISRNRNIRTNQYSDQPETTKTQTDIPLSLNQNQTEESLKISLSAQAKINKK